MKILLPLILLCLCSLASQAEPLKVLNYQLDTKIEFSEPTQISTDSVSRIYPSKAKSADAQLEFIVHRYDSKAVKKMTKAGAPMGQSVRANILGLIKKPKGVNKTLFMGGTAARRVYDSSVPRDHQVHVFQRVASDGSFVTVAVRVFGKNDATGPLLRSIANTFKVSDASEACECCK